MGTQLEQLLDDIRACDICRQKPIGAPLPHAPRPVFQISSTAKLAICGQAPGTRVHLSGRPFTDRSGDRLRDWLGIEKDIFYDACRVAVIPMGFCFPGQTAKGADLPPRAECRETWHDKLMALLPNITLLLAVGRYAMDYHLKIGKSERLQDVVARYEDYFAMKSQPLILPMPHPSWRNTRWLRENPWFEVDYLPRLKQEVGRALFSEWN